MLSTVIKTALIAINSQYIHMSLAPWYLLASVKPIYRQLHQQLEVQQESQQPHQKEYLHKSRQPYRQQELLPTVEEPGEHPALFVLEFTINDEYHAVLSRIVGSGAKILCFSCYIWNIR